MKKLSQEELQGLYTGAIKKQYQKSGRFLHRPAKVGETVLTIVSGKLETLKVAGPDEIVVRNISIGSSAEMYIMDYKTFTKRYVEENTILYVIDGVTWWGCIAKGQVDAFEYSGETITITAPWGEDMLCNPGDFIAHPIGGKEDDIYRIEKETFNQTYSLMG